MALQEIAVCLFQCVQKSIISMRLNHMILSLNTKALNSAGQWSSHLTLSDLVESNEFIKVLIINFSTTPEIRQDHPLNLSISVSGGRETNQDSLSKGDWRGKSSGWKSGTCPWIVVFRGSTSDGAGVSLLEKSTRKGESPVSLASRHVRCSSDESRSLGLERKWVVNFIQS